MRRNPFASRFVLVASLLFVTNGCENSPSDPPLDPPPTSTLRCESPVLATNSALPLERVEVTGISGLTDDVYVEFETPAGKTGITALLVDESGTAAIVVPPNPDDLLGGGSLSLTITDGIESCSTLDFDVLPLDPAVGDPLSDLVLALDELTAALIDQFGADAATLAATRLGELPPEWIPLALLLEATDGFDPATELSQLDPSEREFLQALITKVDLEAAIRGVTDSIEELLPPAKARARTATDHATDLRLSSDKKECEPLGSVPKDLFDLSTPEALQDYIEAARGAADSLGPLSQGISDTAVAFGALGLAAPGVGAVVGYLSFGAVLVQQMRANLYPSAITRVEFLLDESRIEEDWDTEGTDGEIRWSAAKIYSTNNGMGLARVGFDFVTTAAALPSGYGQAIDAAIGVLDFTVKEELSGRLDELEEDPNSGVECWNVGVTEFGPTVVLDDTGEEWVTAEILSGDAVSLDANDKRNIKPERIGTAVIRVKTQTNAFEGPFGFGDESIEVVRKSVRFTTPTLLVDDPGQTETVRFRIDDAKHAGPNDIEIVGGPGLGELPEPTQSGGVYELTFATPADRDDYPTFITVRSISKELPPDSPERSATLDIFADEGVEISPRDVCVPAGETQDFTATVAGAEELTVRWEIESGGGTLSSTTGETVTYSPPLGGPSGPVTLRAYIAENSEAEDRITFRQGACVGLAVYYGQALEIGFPFLPGGDCSNPDLEDEFEDITFPQEGLEPTVLPAPSALWIGRTENFSQSLGNAGTFGDTPPGSQDCVTDFFSAESFLDASFVGSASGTRLDIDIETEATSSCIDMGEDIGVECSSALSSMSLAVRFDFDLTAAANYRLKLDLACDGYSPPNFPPTWEFISIIIIRVTPDGTVLPPTFSTAPIQTTCGPDNPTVSIDRLMQFDAPGQAGDTDHVMVLFQGSNVSFGALEGEIGEARHTGFMRGFISVEKEE